MTEEERRLLDFAEVSSDWFYELDRDLKFSLLSSGSSARTGEDPSALLGKTPIKDGIQVGDEAWAAHLADLDARRPIVDFRFARMDADGRLRHFSINAKPLFDASGDFAGYRGTGREITQIVNAEKFLRDIIDAVPAVIMVKDAESRYVMMNDYYAQTILGTTPAIGTGMVSGAFLGDKAAAIGRAQDQAVLASGVTSQPFQRMMPIADGASRAFLVKKVPLSDGSGPPSRVLTVGMDITPLKDAEKAIIDAQARLRESEKRFRDFAESSSHWLWELDRELRYTFVSDGVRAMTGLPPEDYIGMRLFDTHAGQGMDPAAKRQFLEVLDKREPFLDVPVIQTAADGRIRHLRISGRPFFDDTGYFLGHRGSTRDVTPQYDAEADSAKWRQARDIGASGRHLLGIINDLLDMSRIELGQFQQSPENVALSELIDESVRMARGYAQGLGAAIDAARVDEAWVVHVDRRSMRQVLLNLLSNAAKFTPAGHRIWVRVEGDREGNLTVTVADTGSGIPAERLATIFEPFQQSTAEQARGRRGAGLGLWLSRSLVELHGGRLEIDSREGEGTTAIVTLPASRIVARP